MKLWEIKAQALRIMFADTGLEFSQTEFEDGTITANDNTREKYVRMNDSIQRALDYYFAFCGQILQTTTKTLKSTGGVYSNVIETSAISGFGHPTRVDIVADTTNGILGVNSLSFNFDSITKDIFFTEEDFVTEYESVIDHLTFQIYYMMAKAEIPSGSNEITYDLNLLNIPEEVQRQIPLYVKGELYEEDEANVALAAKNQFFDFLTMHRRQGFMKVLKKVRVRYPRSSQ